MKNLIVTLLSDQPIPNVQFIKEKQNADTYFLFVSTQKMEDKGVGKWIQKVCNIPTETSNTIVVDQFSPIDIESKLNEISYDEFDDIIVNVTGGTKIMSHTVTEFFKEKPDTEIFYLTGLDNIIIQVFPKTKQPEKSLIKTISLKEYIESHGFEMRESRLSGIDPTYTQSFFNYFIEFNDDEIRIINQLRGNRGKTAGMNEIPGIKDFFLKIKFPLSDENFTLINKKEIKYLTGDWLEEYVFFRLKQELPIIDENLKTGITLIKNKILNEFDILFLWNGSLYTIECKTSIKYTSNEEKEENFLNDTIYQATALQKNLGLYSKFSIFTLSSKEKNEVKETHVERGKLVNIDVFCREDIISCKSMIELLKLKLC